MGDDAKRSPFVKFLKHLNDNFQKNGLNFDTIVRTNQELLNHYFPPKAAYALDLIFCWFIAHIRLLMAVVVPAAALIPAQRGNWKLTEMFSNGRTQFTLVLLAFSAIFHVFSIPAYLKPFNWAFTLRPQINVKPKMTMIAKKSRSDMVLVDAAAAETHSSADVISSSKSKSMGNLAEIEDCKTEIDFGLCLKVRDGVTDKFLTFTERALDTFSIASSLSAHTGDSISEYDDAEEYVDAQDFNESCPLPPDDTVASAKRFSEVYGDFEEFSANSLVKFPGSDDATEESNYSEKSEMDA